MNKLQASIIAEKITNQQLEQMFETAKNNITNWTEISNVNKRMTKGASWNILAKGFDCNRKYHILAKTNMIWEFGDFLPETIKQKTIKQNVINDVDNSLPYHQNPEF